MASNAVIALIKNKLQELFAPNDQRLIGLIGVSKPGKKKKLNYLVVTRKKGRILLLERIEQH